MKSLKTIKILLWSDALWSIVVLYAMCALVNIPGYKMTLDWNESWKNRIQSVKCVIFRVIPWKTWHCFVQYVYPDISRYILLSIMLMYYPYGMMLLVHIMTSMDYIIAVLRVKSTDINHRFFTYCKKYIYSTSVQKHLRMGTCIIFSSQNMYLSH